MPTAFSEGTTERYRRVDNVCSGAIVSAVRGVVVVAAAAAAVLSLVPAAAGSLDPAFGGAGIVVTTFGERSSTAVAVAVQPDGKIVAAGTVWMHGGDGDFALARYDRDGILDSTFGVDGFATTDLGGDDGITSVVIEPDGRIVVGGYSGGDFALARYRRDGTPDPSFGRGGTVITDLGREDRIVRVLLARGGRILAVGGSRSGSRAYVWLARYRSNGKLDAVFGTVTTRLRSLPIAAAPTPGGKIVVSAPRVVGPNTTNPPIDIVLLRLARDGTLDRTFGGDGIVVTRARPHSTGLRALAVQPDGKVLVAGHGHAGTGAPPAFMLLRFLANGSLDRSFGDDGVAISTAGFAIRAIAVDRLGRIVAAGASQDLDDFVITRFLPSGRVDPAFGAVTTDFGAYETPWAVAVEPHGAVVAAGQTGRSLGVDTDFALARYR
jgi:uncharacterized delta-60 repeat protein